MLVHAVGGAAIPFRASLLLRWYNVDELAELAPQVIPATLHMPDQRLPFVLCHQKNLPDTGIDTIREHEIDDEKLAAKRKGRFASLRCKLAQALPAAAGHNNCYSPASEPAVLTARRTTSLISCHAYRSNSISFFMPLPLMVFLFQYRNLTNCCET